MHICLNRTRHLKVNHETNILDINTATSQVCRHENIRFAIPQRLQGRLSPLLVFPGMESRSIPLYFISMINSKVLKIK